MTTYDDEISRRYTQGESTGAIARALGLRLVEVIGRVRALNLQPPSMGEYTPPRPQEQPSMLSPDDTGGTADPDEDGPALDPGPRHRPPHRGARNAGRTKERREGNGDLDDSDSEDRGRPGCPRGWLISEDQFRAIFHPGKGHFGDAQIRSRPQATPAQSAGSAAGRHR